MITNFFIPELINHDVQELWFQQDGATCHTARATIDLLKYTFGDRLISRFGPGNLPPRSCDLTRLYSVGLLTCWTSTVLDNGGHSTRHRLNKFLETFHGNDLPNIGLSCPYFSKVHWCRVKTFHALFQNLSKGFKSGILGGQFMTEKSEEWSSNEPVANQDLGESSTLQSVCSLAQERRAARWRALNNGTLVGRRLPKPVR
ncbi:hypothetical protein TNCV_1557081 [Trichonephila clavipes]|nr:hypothetical protein TNCV_1557081 [Trichonephila clavipes]